MPYQREMLHYDKNWQEEYKRKQVSAEEAVKVVKSGDLVVTPLPEQPRFLLETLVARASELRNVTVTVSGPLFDPGWLSAGMEESFNVVAEASIWAARSASDDRRITYLPDLFSMRFKGINEGRKESLRNPDVFMTTISPPDENGFCSFGYNMWHKRSYAKRAKCVIGEVHDNMIRTGGANFIHASEIDYFVVPPSEPDLSAEEWQELHKIFSQKSPKEVDSKLKLLDTWILRLIIDNAKALSYEQAAVLMASGLGLDNPTDVHRAIAHHLKELIRDGDTIQTGVGRPGSFMVRLGVFDERSDLGIHTEMGSPGLAYLVKNGNANGKYKTLHPGKAVFSTFGGCDADDIEFIKNNPAFECYDSEYVANIRTVAQHDNMVAINNILNIDLTGQITAETQFGPRMINGQGGQPEMHIGAFLAKGGRAISLLTSTFLGGMSTIVPQLDRGSLVTIPRQFADMVVTEYGVARLLDKTHRERAEALIEVAHPDHRADLRKEAKKLFWP
jgi:4-hydroxybutyrate CoA-transferase